jgi:hypothetical protein
MSRSLFRSAVAAAVVAGTVSLGSAPTVAAGGAQASKNRPVVAGCPSVSAAFHPCALAKTKTFTPSRTPYGEPDLQGLWDAPLAQGFQNIEDFPGDPSPGGFGPAVTVIVDPADGRVPYHPWARTQRDENVGHYIDPYAQCLPTGVPRQMANFRTRQITQRPGYLTIVNEAGGHIYRVVYMDGRPHLRPGFKLWMGDSRGRWEGNTLVIETANSNGRWWFDSGGHFASDTLRVVERLTMVDADTIHYQATMDDPQVYRRPWTMVFPLERVKEKGYEQMEEACHEGDRDAAGFLLGGFKPYFGPRFPK